MMTMRNASEQIQQAVLDWEFTEAHAHRFNGVEFRIGKRELGHIHGDVLVDIPFPKKVRDDLVAAGQAEPHHVLPESGWISFYIRQPQDVGRAIALFRRSYELALKQKRKHSSEAQSSR